MSDPLVPAALRRRHAQTVKDSTSSYKIMSCHSDQELSKFRRASKSHQWIKSYGHFTEGVDLAYLRSCIGKGLGLQPAQQACYFVYQGVLFSRPKENWYIKYPCRNIKIWVI